MPAIQKLFEACRLSYSSNGPVSEEALEKVRAMLGRQFYLFKAFVFEYDKMTTYLLRCLKFECVIFFRRNV